MYACVILKWCEYRKKPKLRGNYENLGSVYRFNTKLGCYMSWCEWIIYVSENVNKMSIEIMGNKTVLLIRFKIPQEKRASRQKVTPPGGEWWREIINIKKIHYNHLSYVKLFQTVRDCQCMWFINCPNYEKKK